MGVEQNFRLTKEIASKLMAIQGEIRGIDLKADAEFIVKERGEESLKKIKEELEEIGYPIEYERLEVMNFYPGGLKALSLLAIKKVFNFDDRKIEEMGKLAPKTSLIIKLFIKYFSSVSKLFFEETPKIWKEHWTAGEFLPAVLNEEKKFAVVRIKNLNLHPIYCLYLRGYFSTLSKMITGGQKINCQEIKCPFRGDEYHEFLITWQ